jgi:hypothetical protein
MQLVHALNRNEKLFEAIDAMLSAELDPVQYAERLSEADTLVQQGNYKGLLTLFNALRTSRCVHREPVHEDEPDVQLITVASTDFASRVEISDPLRPIPLRLVNGGAAREIAPVVQTILQTRSPRRTRVRFEEEQKRVMQHHFFEEKDYWPSRFMRRKLARLFDMDAAKIYTWFASARAHHRMLVRGNGSEEREKLNVEKEKTLLLMYRGWVNRPRFPV